MECVWIVVPTYNEAGAIERLVLAVDRVLHDCGAASRRILVVDDASPDGTGRILDALSAEVPALEVMHRPAKLGLGRAYLAGFARALEGGADLVVQMDADFSHDPADLPRLLEASQAADVVLGSRYVPGGGVADWGPLRRAISRTGCLYARTLLGVPVRDLTGGFKCHRREVLEQINLPTVRSQGYAFQIELTYRALAHGFGVHELPIVFRDRRGGQSKMSTAIALEAMRLVPALRRYRPPAEPRPANGRAPAPEHPAERVRSPLA